MLKGTQELQRDTVPFPKGSERTQGGKGTGGVGWEGWEVGGRLYVIHSFSAVAGPLVLLLVVLLYSCCVLATWSS